MNFGGEIWKRCSVISLVVCLCEECTSIDRKGLSYG